MKKFKNAILLFVATLLFMTACQDDQEIAPQIVPPNDETMTSERVIVVDSLPSDLQLVRITANELSYTRTDTAENIAPGTILVAGSTSLAEYGYLRQVTHKTVTQEAVIFKTKVSTLAQVFESVPVDFADSITIIPTDVPNGRVNGDASFTIKNQVDVQGNTLELSLTIQPRLDFEWQKAAGEKTAYLKFATHVKAEDISIKGKITNTLYERPFRLLEFNLPPITFAIGPVPVVMKNTLNVVLSANAASDASIGTGLVVRNVSIYAGTEYANGSWKELRGFESSDIELYRPQVSTTSQFNFSLNPELSIETVPYGLEGFAFYGKGGIANAMTLTQAKVSISSKPVLSAGIKADLFGLINQDYSFGYEFNEFYSNEWPLSSLLPVPGIQPEGEGAFGAITDVPAGYWAYEEIKTLFNMGIVGGYGDNTFRPNNRITRAEFATMLIKAFDAAPIKHSPAFIDIENHWARENIIAAARAGYVSGFPDGTFRPDKSITKVELLAMLTQALKVPSVEASKQGPIVQVFRDSDFIADWAVPVVAKATVHELVLNAPDKALLTPTLNVSRADALAMLYRGLVWKGNTILNNYNNFYLVKVKQTGTQYEIEQY